jgi:hypothetical protein
VKYVMSTVGMSTEGQHVRGLACAATAVEIDDAVNSSCEKATMVIQNLCQMTIQHRPVFA